MKLILLCCSWMNCSVERVSRLGHNYPFDRRIRRIDEEYLYEVQEKQENKLNDHCWINHVEYWLLDLESPFYV